MWLIGHGSSRRSDKTDGCHLFSLEILLVALAIGNILSVAIIYTGLDTRDQRS